MVSNSVSFAWSLSSFGGFSIFVLSDSSIYSVFFNKSFVPFYVKKLYILSFYSVYLEGVSSA